MKSAKEVYKPRKIAQVKLPSASERHLTEWLIYKASRAKIVQNTDISKATLLRYIKKIKSGESTVTKLFSVDEVREMIDLANIDWQDFKNGKNKPKQKINIEDQETTLNKVLKKQGWGISRDNLDFAKCLRLESGDEADQMNAQKIVSSWSKEKHRKFKEYKKAVVKNG